MHVLFPLLQELRGAPPQMGGCHFQERQPMAHRIKLCKMQIVLGAGMRGSPMLRGGFKFPAPRKIVHLSVCMVLTHQSVQK